MPGYLDSSLDAEAFDADGFFRTGDLGVIDDEGYVVITGRLKDVIIRNAENISAKEVEDLLYEHPKVFDVAVIGVPDPRTHERVCAVVALEGSRRQAHHAGDAGVPARARHPHAGDPRAARVHRRDAAQRERQDHQERAARAVRREAMIARALDDVTSSLGYGVYDADTHYYEPYDAFTRHIDPEFRDHAVHSRPDAKGRQRPWFGDQPLRFLTVHPEDIVGTPGSLRDVFEHPNESTTGYSIRAAPMSGRDVPAFMEHDARLAFMDEQGIAASLVFPSVGVTVEHEMRHDPPAAMANFVAFNKWLEEDWGLHGRIIGVPLLSLLDIDLAVDRARARARRAAPVLCTCDRRRCTGARPSTRCSTRSGAASTKPASRW